VELVNAATPNLWLTQSEAQVNLSSTYALGHLTLSFTRPSRPQAALCLRVSAQYDALLPLCSYMLHYVLDRHTCSC
jgi:hypothetical protein